MRKLDLLSFPIIDIIGICSIVGILIAIGYRVYINYCDRLTVDKYNIEYIDKK